MQVRILGRRHPGQAGDIGSRRPIGESPGMSTRCLPRKSHSPLSQTCSVAATAALQRQHVAHRLVQAALEDPPQPRALFGVFEPAVGRIDVDRQLPFARAGSGPGLQTPAPRSRHRPPAAAASNSTNRSASANVKLYCRSLGGDQLADCARSGGRPSASSRPGPSAAAARRDTTCLGQSAAARRGEPLVQPADERRRQPPLVRARPRRCSTRGLPCRRSRRTSARPPSSAARRRGSSSSTAWPSASIRGHCSSVYGLVTRGSSWIRVTRITCSNSASHASSAPLIGAADDGSGVAASGMCPSPANRPLVGSRPTQPAPGR